MAGQDDTTRSDVGPILGLLGAVGLTIAFVEGILAELGYASGSAKRLAGRATGSALRVVAGGTRGDLSLFRTLEALAIGVQGKRCLWRAAQALVALPRPPGRRKLCRTGSGCGPQWETIEQHRRSLVPDTFGV
jgi:hypothetical protein